MDREYHKRLCRQQNESMGSTEYSKRPFQSPDRLSSRQVIGDRFIPCRPSAAWQNNFFLQQENTKPSGQAKKSKDASADGSKDGAAYSLLLKNELLGASYEDIREHTEDKKELGTHDMRNSNLFTYQVQGQNVINEASSPYSLFPISSKSQKLLCPPRKAARKISGTPYDILHVPELADDFYLNLVDWSSTNVLSIGLGTCVHLWNVRTSQVTQLCDLSTDGDTVTSVSWAERGNLVAVGTHKGYVQVWDVGTTKCMSALERHSDRVGTLAWNGDILTSGSRDRLILQRDVRTPSATSERRLVGHGQEVCSLKWSPNNQHLASGGSDNKLYVWNMNTVTPIQTYTEHVSAVKAIAWSRHHHGLLASGGGTADRCIRFWNTLTGQPMQRIDTGSQVCNLAWSKHTSEFVSTHGYSENQILVWKYPELTQVAKLTGHSYRVLYLAMSPDGENIVTGAGDEKLLFWNVFSKARSQKEAKSALNLFASIR